MSKPISDKVLLVVLTERISARGTVYLSGLLGRARIVGFRETDEQGRDGWALYLSEPRQRPGSGPGGQP